MHVIKHLYDLKLLNPPQFLVMNTHYQTIMGSVAYGVSSDTSDCDIYGFCIPDRQTLFPWEAGEILGFGTQLPRFEQFQQHHIEDKSALNGKGRSYDISIYNIVKYFDLCMKSNPNMIDSIFTPTSAVQQCTKIGHMVRDNRKLFLSKGCWFKFKSYAYSQVHKMKNRTPQKDSRRAKDIEEKGFDVKYAYHIVRLLDEVEQIMINQDIDLQRNNEQLKAIRRGDWKEEDIIKYFDSKERELESIYLKSTLREYPDEKAIKQLLINCLEEHYGDLKGCVVNPSKDEYFIKKLLTLVEEYRT